MMRSIKQWFRREHGQSIILVAIAITMLCGVVALVVDVGRVSVAQGQLQNAADAAALAAARELPSASAASTAAKTYAGYNGVLAANTTATTPYKSNANRVEVVCTETVEYTFAKVIGLNSTVVSARAVAEKSGLTGGAFGYALFSGNPIGSISLSNYDLTIGGSAHSNGSVGMSGTLQTITGNCEAVKSVVFSGYNQTVGGTLQGASITTSGTNLHFGSTLSTAASNITMPDFSADAISEATSSGLVYTGNKSFGGYKVDVESNVYVNGNITISGTEIVGKGIMVANGDINLGAYKYTNTSSSSVCMFACKSNASINISGTSITIYGILYAPYGTVNISAYDLTIYGRVIAKNINISGTKIKIISGSNDLDCLPGGTICLVE